MTNDKLSKKLFDALLISVIIIILMFAMFNVAQAIRSIENNFRIQIEDFNG
jgi:HAMP domain-containing protein